MFKWFYREVPESLRPAKGIINGLILGILFWLIILLTIVSICYAEGPADNKWTWKDTAYESVYLGLHFIDWRQTLYISEYPDKFHELNPLLGKHPSQSQVNIYCIASMLAHAGFSYLLPSKWKINLFDTKITLYPRRYWQVSSIMVKTGIVVHNFNVGIRMEF